MRLEDVVTGGADTGFFLAKFGGIVNSVGCLNEPSGEKSGSFWPVEAKFGSKALQMTRDSARNGSLRSGQKASLLTFYNLKRMESQ